MRSAIDFSKACLDMRSIHANGAWLQDRRSRRFIPWSENYIPGSGAFRNFAARIWHRHGWRRHRAVPASPSPPNGIAMRRNSIDASVGNRKIKILDATPLTLDRESGD
jgi:hypothetical protein